MAEGKDGRGGDRILCIGLDNKAGYFEQQGLTKGTKERNSK